MTTQGYVGRTQWEKNKKPREFKKKIIKWLKLNLKDVYRSLEPTMGGNISIPFYGLFLGTMALVTNPLVWTPLNKMASLSKNRHLLEVSRAIMFTMRVPNTFGVRMFLQLRTWSIECVLGFWSFKLHCSVFVNVYPKLDFHFLTLEGLWVCSHP